MKYVVFFATCSFVLVFMSSSRQSILGLTIVIVLRFAIFTRKNLENNFPIHRLVFSIGIVYIISFLISELLPILNIDVVNNTLQSGDDGRMILYTEAIQMFKENTAFGLGLGGFEYLTISDQAWPHNFFLEILCECGLLGLLFLLGLIILFVNVNKLRLLATTEKETFYFLLMVPSFVSFMVSGDFRSSIILFCILFATTKSKNAPMQYIIK